MLGPLARGTQDETGDGVQFIGDGAEAQSSGLKGDRAAAGGNVEDNGVRAGQVGIEPGEFVRVGIVCKGTPVFAVAFLVAFTALGSGSQPL